MKYIGRKIVTSLKLLRKHIVFIYEPFKSLDTTEHNSVSLSDDAQNKTLTTLHGEYEACVTNS